MARYQQVHVRFWRDPEVRSWSDAGKVLAQYLLTSAHRATEGLFYLPKAYVAADLEWGMDKVAATFDEIGAFAVYDETVEVVWIVNALKYQPPTGSRQVGGAITRLQQLPETRLWGPFCESVRDLAPDLWEKMEEESMTADTLYGPENEGRIGYTESGSDPQIQSSDSSSNSNSSSSPPDEAGRFPTRSDDGKSYTSTVAAWAIDNGYDPPDTNRRSDAYRWALEVTAEHLDPNGSTGRRCFTTVIREMAETICEDELEPSAVKQLKQLVNNHGGPTTLRVIAQALDQGAGLDPEYEGDPRAVVKYAAAILRNERKAYA